MKIWRTLIPMMLIAAVAAGQKAGTKRIAEGDLLTEVYSQLGTPVLEYPLDGKLVMQYTQCTVVSSNGSVISVEYDPKAAPEGKVDAPAAEDAPPTIGEIKALAMKGDAESQYLLAYCFQFGNAVEKDYGKAIAWYKKAAMQNHMASQHNLGYLYMRGRGTEQDDIEAYMWALLASENGNDTLLTALDHRISEQEKQVGKMRAEHMRLQMQAQTPE